MAERTNRNNNMASRGGPYERNAAPAATNQKEPSNADLELDTPAGSIKVSSTYEVPKLAEAICVAARAMGDLPPLLTIGNASINQCVKGIAAAFAELSKEGIELSFQPAFRHENRTRALIAFYLTATTGRPVRVIEDAEGSQLSVGASSKIVSLAGAIAGRVRDNNHVQIIAVGVDAVTNAVLAAGNARLFLEKDNMDIKVRSEFIKIPKNGGELNALRFTCMSEPI